MDKSRFLSHVSIYRNFILSIFLLLVFFWWFFIYAPLLGELSNLRVVSREAKRQIKSEPRIVHDLLSEKLTHSQLILQNSSIIPTGKFSKDTLSKDLLLLIDSSKVTLLFLRTHPWHEKKCRKSCIVEVCVNGSFSACCNFLDYLKAMGARLKSCVIEAETEQVKVTSRFIIVHNKQATGFNKLDIHGEDDFSSIRNIFLPYLKQNNKQHAAIQSVSPSENLAHKSHFERFRIYIPEIDEIEEISERYAAKVNPTDIVV